MKFANNRERKLDNSISDKIEHFNSFVFRTPLCSLDFFEKKISLLNEDFILSDPLLKESIFIASPELIIAIERTKKGKPSEKDKLKLKISILKYFARMSTRCTPFGIFAGIGVGKMGLDSKILINSINDYRSRTRLDMNYLCALIHDISNLEFIKRQVKFYPNTSLYVSGKNIRYTEYSFSKSKKKFTLAQAEITGYLNKVLVNAANGAKIEDLARLLLDYNISFEEAHEFIDILISNQILVSDLEPSVTGNELLLQLIEKLKKLKKTEPIIDKLRNIDQSIKNIDIVPIGRSISLYENVKNQLVEFDTKYDIRYLFQTDLLINTKNATLDNSIIQNVKDTISIFNQLTPKIESPSLTKFKEDFYNRYEEEEVPLVQALDVETGIGFGNANIQQSDITPLLDDILIPEKLNNYDVRINHIQAILLKKYETFLRSPSLKEIEIFNHELIDLPHDLKDLPDTFSAMIEVIRTEESPEGSLIVMKNVMGPSAANILSRFCFLDSQLHSLVSDITKIENKVNSTRILAEIVHLPESRLGNILMRPNLRDYEIPYLANTSVEMENVIPLSDLMVSVPHGRYIKLRSKKANIEIIPRLTNAHNFSNDSLPIYNFLCTLQSQNIKVGIGFNWSPLLDQKPFLPRVRYNNIIFSPATWNFNFKDIKDIPNIVDKNFSLKAKEFRKRNELPDKVLLCQGDNKLFVDFNYPLSVQMLFSEVKNKSFRLEEFLYDDNYPLVKRNNEVYTNQIIICFYKN